ncbi:hypothetical protein D7D52_28265 [Nocardia yunnanensis]|uniref:Uncharacterized protein n=1 Tax=Nocardia yunnanensis TaxID=2382165 RepID=A0A386ZK96_9NOCA|nr:hypothetical protein [Nocardia yunnanensis]AYF77059.1 hypothetical protein D7D52_28265 [Nocardia yunnanensis]
MSGDDHRAARRELLAEGNRLQQAYRASKPADSSLAAAADTLRTRYRDSLPVITVSRSPLSDRLVERAMDVVDFDGWFWDYDNAVRPLPQRGDGWLAMSGAARLTEPVTAAPFDCHPGPDLPYVVPGMLRRPGTYAVISQLDVGRHTCWAINYFGPGRPYPLIHEWGIDRNDLHDSGGYWRADDAYIAFNRDVDFELRPWLETGQLLWVAPGDSEFTLRSGAADCPYLELDGDRRGQIIRNGDIHTYEFRGS